MSKKNNNKYLENKYCTLEPLFNIDYSKTTNFISTCLFDMKKDAYRTFDKYLEGIGTFKKLLEDNLPDWKLRIFIDETITENKSLMKQLTHKNNSHLQLIKFNCPNYLMNNSSNRHKGVFGTLLRLFPFFDLPNNDAGIVICDDLDWEYKMYAPIFLTKIRLIEQLINNNNLNDKKFNLCFRTTNNYYEKQNKVVEWVIMSSFISHYNKINPKFMNDFFTFLDKKDTIIYVEHYLDIMKDFAIKHNEDEIGKKFTYGLDEYFLNHFIVNNLKNNIIKFKSFNFKNFINIGEVADLRHVMYKQTQPYSNLENTTHIYNTHYGGYNNDNNSLFIKNNLNKIDMKEQEILHDKYVRFLFRDIINSSYYKFITYINLYTIINDFLYNKLEYGLVQPLVSNKEPRLEYLNKITTFGKDIKYIEKFNVLVKFYIKFYKLLIHIKNTKKYNNIFTKLRVNFILKAENFGIIRREYIEKIIDNKKTTFNYVYKTLDEKDIEELKKLKNEKFYIKELL